MIATNCNATARMEAHGHSYLVHLTLASGEVEVPVHYTVVAHDREEAEARVREFLQEYSTNAEPLGYLWYCYEGGAFAFKCSSIHRATLGEIERHIRIRF